MKTPIAIAAPPVMVAPKDFPAVFGLPAFTRAGLSRLRASEGFPVPLQIGPQVFYRYVEVLAWLDARTERAEADASKRSARARKTWETRKSNPAKLAADLARGKRTQATNKAARALTAKSIASLFVESESRPPDGAPSA